MASASLAELAQVDITASRFKANPFAFYARLRRDAPVFAVRVRGKQRAWLVTRYDEVLQVLKDDERFVKNRTLAMSKTQLAQAPRMPPMFKALERNLLGLDGSDHTRLKALVHQAFTPRMVEQMRELTTRVTSTTLDRAMRKGRVDLIADFALPIPLTVIGLILGVPPEDNHKFKSWMAAFVSLGSRNPIFIIPSLLRFVRYLRRLIHSRRNEARDDLVSALVTAQEGTDRLSDDEVLAMVFLLLSAGHETTVNLLATGVLALLQHPTELNRLRSDPSLIKSAVEELARFVVPAEMATERYAMEDVAIGGAVIPKGEMVLAVIASANRYVSQFADPDRIDVGRDKNRHLSFGMGVHYCLGAPLSRMEAQIALSALFERAPAIKLSVAPEQLQWREGLILRGLKSLPITLAAR